MNPSGRGRASWGIDSRNETHSWSTVGASSNIIEASFHALVDSIEYGLLDCGTEPLGHSEQKPTERSDVGATREALEAT